MAINSITKCKICLKEFHPSEYQKHMSMHNKQAERLDKLCIVHRNGYNKAIEDVMKIIDDFIFHIGTDWESYNAVEILKEIKKEMKK